MGPSRRRLGSADCCPCVGGPSPGHVPAHRSQGSTLLSSAPPGADPCLSTPTRHPRAGAAPAVPGRVGQLLSSVSSLSQCANGMVRRAPSLRSWHHESHACPGGCVWALVGNGVGLRSVLGTGGQGSGGQSSSPGAWLCAPACGGTGRSQSSAPRAGERLHRVRSCGWAGVPLSLVSWQSVRLWLQALPCSLRSGILGVLPAARQGFGPSPLLR